MRSNGIVQASNDFMLIYQAAKEDNRKELNRLFKLYKTVDIKDEIHVFTPAARLASEGNHEAVALLRMLGANDDYIAMGYASKNYKKEAEDLRLRRGVKLKYLVIGAAMYDDHTYADELKQIYRLRPEWLVLGAAYAKHHDYVEKLMLESCEPSVRLDALFAQMNGYVLAGEMELAKQLLEANSEDKKVAGILKVIMGDKDEDGPVSQSLTTYSKLIKIFTASQDEELALETTRQTLKFGSRLYNVNVNTDPVAIISDVAVSSHFYNAELLIYALAFVDSVLLDKLSVLAINVDDSASIQARGFSIEACVNSAKVIRQWMLKYGFNYEEANYFEKDASLRDLLRDTAGFDGVKRDQVMRDYWWKHSNLPTVILQTMMEKYRLALAKDYVCQKGQEYMTSTWSLTSNHKERVVSLNYAVSRAETLSQVRTIAFKQFGMFTGAVKGSQDLEAPKHEQEISNKTQAALYEKLEEVFESKLLNY